MVTLRLIVGKRLAEEVEILMVQRLRSRMERQGDLRRLGGMTAKLHLTEGGHRLLPLITTHHLYVLRIRLLTDMVYRVMDIREVLGKDERPCGEVMEDGA